MNRKLKELINISKMVNDLYRRLTDLELNNGKESLEYQKFYQYLLMVLDIEKEQYQKLELNAITYEELTYSLKPYFDLEEIDVNYIIVSGDYKNIAFLRVVNKLLYYFKGKDEYLYNLFAIQLKDKIKEITDKSFSDQELFNIFQYLSDIKRKTEYLFLISIENKLSNKVNNFMKEELKKSFYNYVFVNPYLEEEMIKSLFLVNDHITLDTFNILEEDRNKITSAIFYDSCFNAISDLACISDISYELEDTRHMAIMIECFLENYIGLLNEEYLNILKKSFEELFNSKEYIEKFGNDKISKYTILNILNNYNRYKDNIQLKKGLELKKLN